jgi:hydrogenase maturation protease
MKTLILGIGNSILGDDGIGVRAAQELAAKISDRNVTVCDVCVDGLNLLEIITGYDRMIVIDSIVTENGEVGEIYRLRPEQIYPPSGFSVSPHHFNLATTLEIGRRLFPGEIPEEVTVFAVDTEEATEVTEEMTEKVRLALPEVIRLVLEEVSAPLAKR